MSRKRTCAQIEERFWNYVNKTDTCWLWTKGKDRDGYGQFKLTYKKTVRSHRFAWELANDRPIPNGLLVLHRCDNPTCVNPEHLFLGTNTDNARDRVSKKRYIGEDHRWSKLTEKDVREIKQVHPYFSRAELGKIYGVSAPTIWCIAVGRNWSHVD